MARFDFFKRKSFLIILLLTGLLLLVTLSPGPTQATVPQDTFINGKTCEQVSDEMFYGAGQGQCYLPPQYNRPIYIREMTDSSRSCTVSYSCPTGTRPTCKVDISTRIEDSLNCDVVYSSSGAIDTCTQDSECESNRCANGYCQESGGFQSGSCNTPGKTICITSDTYQQCLNNGQWSGRAHCKDSTCQYGRCGGECTPNWELGEWSECKEGSQTRTCEDKNSCSGSCPEQTLRTCENTESDICAAFNWAPEIVGLDKCTSGVLIAGGVAVGIAVLGGG